MAEQHEMFVGNKKDLENALKEAYYQCCRALFRGQAASIAVVVIEIPPETMLDDTYIPELVRAYASDM